MNNEHHESYECKRCYMDLYLDFGPMHEKSKIEMDENQFQFAIFCALKTLFGDTGCAIKVDILYYNGERRAYISFSAKNLTAVWSALCLFSKYDGLDCMFLIYKVTPVLAALNLNSRGFKHKRIMEKCPLDKTVDS